MTARVIIADASPLIALARINHLHLLRQLFKEVWLTDTVELEIFAGGHSDSTPIRQAIKDGWLQVTTSDVDSKDTDTIVAAEVEGLDPGEATSILWATDLQDAGKQVVLIIDEAKGRKIAHRLSLEVMGSAGIIAIAKRVNLIEQAHPLLIQLCESGYRLSPTVIAAALRIAGEG